MSKSLGNALDPLDVIDGITLNELQQKLLEGNLDPSEVERARSAQAKDFPHGIPTCGTDALRFGLCSYTSQGRAINLDVFRVQAHRCFCNKLWQACRYLLLHALTDWKPKQTWLEMLNYLQNSPKAQLQTVDRWMLCCLADAVVQCNDGFNKYELSKSTQALHEMWMYDFCDVYLEYSKSILKDSPPDSEGHPLTVRCILWLVVRTGLLLLHPFMPFVTEELYQRLIQHGNNEITDSICITPYPESNEWKSWLSYQSDQNSMKECVLLLINTIRSFRTANDIPVSKSMRCHLIQLNNNDNDATTLQQRTLLMEQSVLKLISQLTRCDLQDVLMKSPNDLHNIPHLSLPITLNGIAYNLIMYTEGVINVDKLLTSVQSKRAKLLPALKKLEEKMNKSDYTSKVPPNVQDSDLEKLKEMKQTLEQLDNTAASLQADDCKSLLNDEKKCDNLHNQVITFVLNQLNLSITNVNTSDKYSLAATLLEILIKHKGEKVTLAERCIIIQWLCWCEQRWLPALIALDHHDNSTSSTLLLTCFNDLQQTINKKLSFEGVDLIIRATFIWFKEYRPQHLPVLSASLEKNPIVNEWIWKK
jgi:valyl-tRNA synthetase